MVPPIAKMATRTVYLYAEKVPPFAKMAMRTAYLQAAIALIDGDIQLAFVLLVGLFLTQYPL